jgi:hypothetical protein
LPLRLALALHPPKPSHSLLNLLRNTHQNTHHSLLLLLLLLLLPSKAGTGTNTRRRGKRRKTPRRHRHRDIIPKMRRRPPRAGADRGEGLVDRPRQQLFWWTLLGQA